MRTEGQPTLRVIEGGYAQLVADIESAAENLRELEERLATAREELRHLLASLGPISMTMSWRRLRGGDDGEQSSLAVRGGRRGRCRSSRQCRSTGLGW